MWKSPVTGERGARWVGIFEDKAAGWIGRCTGPCDRLYVLEAGEHNQDGILIGWPCTVNYGAGDNPAYPAGAPKFCGGKIKVLPRQKALIASWAIGGIEAVLAIVDKTRKG